MGTVATMRAGIYQIRSRAVLFAASAFLCLLPGFARSSDTAVNPPVSSYRSPGDLARSDLVLSDLSGRHRFHPGTPMVLDPITGAFEFDLGGSETRKLQLQLAHPIVLEAGHHLFSIGPGSNQLGLDSVLRMPLGNGLSLHGGAEQILGTTQFQTLGSIQCLNGTLGPDSYTASGCHFVSGADATFDRRTLNLGASHESGNLSTSMNWFTTAAAENGAVGVYKLSQFNNPAVLLDNAMLTPLAGDKGLPGAMSAAYINSETTGIDLNFQLGIATDQAGEIRLGLALTRVLDANYQGIYGHSLGTLDWSVAKPFDSAALGIEWNRGAFSSGIRGYYREPVSFLNHENLDSMSTFDVHFTWRAPWKANLSIGASNVLGAGVNERNNSDKTTDPYESIYGRIPYVRYQQDL